MRLVKAGPNAMVLEVEGGSVLFSYENVAAVRQGELYDLPVLPISKATMAHIKRFVPPGVGGMMGSQEFLEKRAREVLTANLRGEG